jgi:hypothetical protein
MYNLTNGTSVFSVNSQLYSIPVGFYGAYDLATQMTKTGSLGCTYLTYQGKFMFTGSGTFKVLSAQLSQILGVTLDAPMDLSGSPSSNVIVNMNLGEYVFLDIDELKTPTHVYTGAFTTTKQGLSTVSGSNTSRSFAPIALDVNSGCMKNLHENKDYKVSVKYPEPIGSIDRLTVKWLDVTGNTLIFNGLDTNAFLLRFYVKDPSKKSEFLLDELPPPVPFDGGPNIMLATALLLAGLLMILFVKKTSNE